MKHNRRAAQLAVVLVVAVGAGLASAQTRKEYRFIVRPRATVSVSSPYGPISVKAVNGNIVLITAVFQSDKVEIDQGQRGNRIEVVSRLMPGSDAQTGQVSYEISVPPDASVNLRATTGPLHAEKLRGDVILEGTTAAVDVRDIANAHVHVRTMSGPVVLTDIRNGHVEVTAVSGDVTLNNVVGPNVQVSSSSGNIRYDGSFGSEGEYSLSSHSGDIEATAPGGASIDVIAQSVKGSVDSDFSLEPRQTSFVGKAGSSFVGTLGKALARVKLRSFSGKIHLKKR